MNLEGQTDFGTWGEVERCVKGTFANTFRLKLHRYDGADDDTSLNGIRLTCKDASGR